MISIHPMLALPILAGKGPVPDRRKVRPVAGSPADAVRFSSQLPLPDAQYLRTVVEDLSRMGRGSYKQEGLEKAANYIKGEWETLGLKVEEQPFRFYFWNYKNLMTSFGPPDAERIVIGAHYDTHKGYPGADDNASGVAGLLALARMLKRYEPKLNKRIDLVAWTLEERFLNGSRYHAAQLHREKARIKGAISLECIGYYSDKPKSQALPAKFALKRLYPQMVAENYKGNFIAVVGDIFSRNWIREVTNGINAHSTVRAEQLAGPMLPLSIFRSDHTSYRLHGRVPSLMITDTANLRNPNYHRPTDTPDTLDYERMAQVIRGVYGLIVSR